MIAGWQNVFFPWWIHAEYRRDPPADFELTDVEQSIKGAYDLDDAQMYWRRRKIIDDHGGKVDDFDEQYPDCPEKAFQTKGNLVFSGVKKTLKELLTAFEPGIYGDMEKVITDRVQFVEDLKGTVEILRMPERGRTYCMGSDAGEGIKDKELSEYVDEDGKQIYTTYSTCSVRDNETWELCALMECRKSEPVFADAAMLLGNYYNQALWAVEIPGPGKGVIGRAIGRYKRLYYHEWQDRLDDNKWKSEVGWKNAGSSRQTAKSKYEQFIREEPDKLGSKRLVSQLMTYYVDAKTEKWRPKVRCFSDLLWADIICVYILGSRQVETPNAGAIEKFQKNQRKKKHRPLVKKVAAENDLLSSFMKARRSGRKDRRDRYRQK